MNTSTDRIEKEMVLKASRARVWRALSNAEEFGRWFGVDFAGQQFAPNQTVSGKMTFEGYTHVTLTAHVERIEPERLFSFRWHPYAIDPAVDYSAEPTTLVEFELGEAEGGVLLRITESGFDAIPAGRRPEAFRMNSRGWEMQAESIAEYVEAP